MSVDRIDRVNELLRREIGEALYHVMSEESTTFDLSAVTITHVIAKRDLKAARVLVSILGHEDDRKRMLRRLYRHRGEIQALINRHLKLKYTPRLTFELDSSVEGGHRILGVLAELEEAEGPPLADEEAAGQEMET